MDRHQLRPLAGHPHLVLVHPRHPPPTGAEDWLASGHGGRSSTTVAAGRWLESASNPPGFSGGLSPRGGRFNGWAAVQVQTQSGGHPSSSGGCRR
ncbi:hypothetical protein RHGRI_034072 [Rhododendron griersonianum]|uniref:Uncharacterized protein n=1 Tax=Rhododendron griersonianum TaxID=479676 RepID=A0AAV6I1S2_9ERIC|nr:hypothetical protein RHGRI_034072 [Rhododendron griersonianum]